MPIYYFSILFKQFYDKILLKTKNNEIKNSQTCAEI